MAKITIPDIASQFASQEALNARFTQVENELNDKVLYRDNPEGEPNAMAQELDMNTNRIINLPEPVNPNDAARLQDVTQAVLSADSIIATQAEAVTLTAGQTTVVFATYETVGASFNLSGPNVDDARLVLGRDFLVSNSTTIQLSQSYPAGTTLQLLRNAIAGEDALVIQAQAAYDTVVQMKLDSSVAGTLIQTKGYYTAGDASQAVDGYGDHTLVNGNVALLQAEGVTYLKQYGAVADGVVNDQAAVQAALNKTGVIDGEDYSYRIDSTLVLNNDTTVRNAVIDFSNSTSADILFDAIGSVGSSIAVSTDGNYGDTDITFSGADTYVTGDYFLVQSDKIWSTDGASSDVVCGETLMVRGGGTANRMSITGTLNNDYLVSDNAVVYQYNKDSSNIHLDHITADGGNETENRYFAYFKYSVGCSVKNSTYSSFGSAGVAIETSVDVSVVNNHISKILNASLGYATLILSACLSIFVSDNHVEQCRTGVTCGGTQGVARDIVVTGNRIYGAFTAGINSKDAVLGMIISNNTVVGDGQAGSGLGDGIRFRGTHVVINGNTIKSCFNNPIICSVYGDGSIKELKCIVTNNIVEDAEDSGILILNNSTRELKGLVVSNNVLNFNAVATLSRGSIDIDANTGSINNFSVTGNVINNTPFNGVSMSAADATPANPGSISNGIIIGNVIERSAAGISGGRAAIVEVNTNNTVSTPNVTV